MHLFRTIPTSFVPNEDQGYILAQIIMPDAASLNRTVGDSARWTRCSPRTRRWKNRTMINGYSLIDGQYKPNVATFFVTLKDFKERYSSMERAKKENSDAVLSRWRRGARNIETGVIIPIAPPAIPGIGTTGGFEFWIQDKGSGDPARLYEVTQQFLAKARTRPELSGLNTTFRAASQQLRAEVDRAKAVLLGVPVRMSTARCRPSSARSWSASSTSTAGSGTSSSSPMRPTARPRTTSPGSTPGRTTARWCRCRPW